MNKYTGSGVCRNSMARTDVFRTLHLALTIKDQTRLKIVERLHAHFTAEMVFRQRLHQWARRLVAVHEVHAPEGQRPREDDARRRHAADQPATPSASSTPGRRRRAGHKDAAQPGSHLQSRQTTPLDRQRKRIAGNQQARSDTGAHSARHTRLVGITQAGSVSRPRRQSSRKEAVNSAMAGYAGRM